MLHLAIRPGFLSTRLIGDKNYANDCYKTTQIYFRLGCKERTKLSRMNLQPFIGVGNPVISGDWFLRKGAISE